MRVAPNKCLISFVSFLFWSDAAQGCVAVERQKKPTQQIQIKLSFVNLNLIRQHRYFRK